MSDKFAHYLWLSMLILIGVAYYFLAGQIPSDPGNIRSISPEYFPKLLALVLIGLSIIGLIQTILTKENRTIELPNSQIIALTVALTMVFFVTWRSIGFPYILIFFFLLTLSSIYSRPRLNFRTLLLRNTLSALGVTLFIYILFDRIMQLRL